MALIHICKICSRTSKFYDDERICCRCKSENRQIKSFTMGDLLMLGSIILICIGLFCGIMGLNV